MRGEGAEVVDGSRCDEIVAVHLFVIRRASRVLSPTPMRTLWLALRGSRF